MSKPAAEVFYFVDYAFDEDARLATMRYRYDDGPILVDEVEFGFEFAHGYNRAVLERVLRGLWLMSGVSYLKALLPPKIMVQVTTLDAAEAEFFSQVYRLGLGQLCYENGLSLERVARFPAGDGKLQALMYEGQGSVLGFGGGKDSLVSAGLLAEINAKFATMSAVYSPDVAGALAEAAGLLNKPHLAVRRSFDGRLRELNDSGYNGHVPVSAIIGFIGLAAAVLTGRERFIFSNEASAGEGNLMYEGVEINHQYSKSFEYERAFSRYIDQYISPSLECFSLLRPLGELAIAELFVRREWPRFRHNFTSCNRSFREGSSGFEWCGECSKCAFVFLVLAPFAGRDELVEVFGGDMFERPELAGTYSELLGLSGHKPFECVGEVAECQQALRMVQSAGAYPAAGRWRVPEGALEYRRLQESALVSEYEAVVTAALRRLRHE